MAYGSLLRAFNEPNMNIVRCPYAPRVAQKRSVQKLNNKLR